MNNQVSKVDKTFDEIVREKYADATFGIPAAWKVGRPERDPSYNFDNGMVWNAAYSYNSVSLLKFDDFFAPYGASNGTIVCFTPSAKTDVVSVVGSAIEKRRENKNAAELEKINDPYYLPGILEFFQYKWIIGANLAATIYALLFMIDVSQYGWGSAIGGILLIWLAVTCVMAGAGAGATVIQESLREKTREDRRKGGVKKVSEKKIVALENKDRKTAENDEVFFVGAYSLVPQVVKISKDHSQLVRDKLRLNPDGAELQLWCQAVIEINCVQNKIKNGFPSDLIPMMSNEAADVLKELVEIVNDLKQQWVEKQLMESKVLEEGSFILESYAVEDSKAVREGASHFLKSLTVDEYNSGS